MSGVCCILIFALLFAMVVVNTTKQENNSKLFGKSTETKICRLFSNETDTAHMCDVECFSPANLTEEMEAAIANDDICSSIGYHLRYEEPGVTTISPGWFKTNAIINKITIRDVRLHGEIIDIEPGAFDDCTFGKMTELVIRRTKVTVLKKGTFEGANSLKKISFEENDLMQHIEEYTLDPLYQLEEMTMMQQPRFENLLSLTGTTQLKQLRTLTLSFNNFNSSINADTFKGCSRVEILNLSNSAIQTIGIGSFEHMVETIQFLDLSNNQLKHLPTNLLANLIRRPNMKINLSDNLWSCDCDSLELQSWFIDNSSLIFDYPLMCDMPDQGREITDVDLSMCESNSTTSTDSETGDITTNTRTTPVTTASTPPHPPFLERLDCLNEKYSSGQLYLEKVYQYFSVKQVEMGKVSVEIGSPDDTLSMVVINDKDEAECRYEINRQMTFDKMDPNAAHLFCLIKKNSYATSPRNCYPFHFDDTLSIWGHDEIIIALVCSIVLSLVAGILCGWLLSWRYQRIFKAKKIPPYQSSARSTSKTATEIEDFDLSITSDYRAGRRTYSDNSIVSCKSYITALTPSPFEIIQWKLRKNAMNSNDSQVRDYLDKLEYDCLPPPLPPHPNRRHSERIYETVDEPVYMCTSEIVPYRITYAS